ncbi:MAG: hypothetical protein JOZ16_08160 [Methylobacteriaceae bacterium]|nr:hypothetical protein [Methylobacteriaceae bacterium]MBV9842578.1 hypothetical protein [Sphingomonadaceae bacterium]
MLATLAKWARELIQLHSWAEIMASRIVFKQGVRALAERRLAGIARLETGLL